MADVKISELENKSLSSVKENGIIPVAVAGIGTYGVNVSELGSDNVFFATYGVTTETEIANAAGKIVVLRIAARAPSESNLFAAQVVSDGRPSLYRFIRVDTDKIYSYEVAGDTWTTTEIPLSGGDSNVVKVNLRNNSPEVYTTVKNALTANKIVIAFGSAGGQTSYHYCVGNGNYTAGNYKSYDFIGQDLANNSMCRYSLEPQIDDQGEIAGCSWSFELIGSGTSESNQIIIDMSNADVATYERVEAAFNADKDIIVQSISTDRQTGNETRQWFRCIGRTPDGAMGSHYTYHFMTATNAVLVIHLVPQTSGAGGTETVTGASWASSTVGEYTGNNGVIVDNNNRVIRANVGDGLKIKNGALAVALGTGLDFDSSNRVVTVSSGVSSGVAAIDKMQNDLDDKLNTNFPMPMITNDYDFSDVVSSGGATMLYQAFTIPINSPIRITGNKPTLLTVYAKQAYDTKIILALYVYDYNNDSTDYVGDTGPISITAGRSSNPLKSINPNVTELKSDCVYYAGLYLPATHSGGLFLSGAPAYGKNMNATPRFTVKAGNICVNGHSGAQIDINDPTSNLASNDGAGNYYIGPWLDGYNEECNIPRFFLSIRNGSIGD